MQKLLDAGFMNGTLWWNKPGVYVLLLKGRVMYVGQSAQPIFRVCSHSKTISFDQVWILHCEKEQLRRLEWEWIGKLKPKVNREIPQPWLADMKVERREYLKLPPSKLTIEAQADMWRALKGKLTTPEMMRVERRF